MMSFRKDRLLREPISMQVLSLVGAVDEFKGRQQLYHQQAPQVLEALRQIAIVQSTESSNRIEGIEIPRKKLREIMAQKVEPRSRPEAEVAGYRDVLGTIHASYEHIPVKPTVILQLHRDLYRYVPSQGGRWKPVDNTIDDVLPDGTHKIRFKPVAWLATPGAMDELCAAHQKHVVRQDVHPLLRVGAFVFDFLCVHPFIDGNGRMARLLSLLLLYQSGYEVGRYISLERVIEESRETYYEALKASSRGWHEGKHTLQPWWEYFLGILLAASREMESRAGMVKAGRGAKTNMVRRTVERLVADFSVSELVRLCPGVSIDMIRNVLKQLRHDGAVECLGTGRSARWRKRR